MRQEMAIEPSTGSTPKFWKIESLEPGRSPAADEMHDCSCRRRSSSQRSCARHDSRPGGRAGAIAGTHSARAPKETRRKRMPREERSRNYLNALTSLRSELVARMRLAQAIFCACRGGCPQTQRLDLRGRTRAATSLRARKLIAPRLASAYS